MAKKNREPIFYSDGTIIEFLDDLIKDFRYDELCESLLDNSLITWLEARYENDIADKLKTLNKEDEYYISDVHRVFGLKYEIEEKEDIFIASPEQEERIEVLKKYTTDTRIYKYIDNVAFNQYELYDLLDEESEFIFLCGENFKVPYMNKSIIYIGIGKPIINIEKKYLKNLAESGLEFINCKFSDEVIEGLFVDTDFDDDLFNYLYKEIAKEDYDFIIDSLNYDDGEIIKKNSSVYDSIYVNHIKRDAIYCASLINIIFDLEMKI